MSCQSSGSRKGVVRAACALVFLLISTASSHAVKIDLSHGWEVDVPAGFTLMKDGDPGFINVREFTRPDGVKAETSGVFALPISLSGEWKSLDPIDLIFVNKSKKDDITINRFALKTDFINATGSDWRGFNYLAIDNNGTPRFNPKNPDNATIGDTILHPLRAHLHVDQLPDPKNNGKFTTPDGPNFSAFISDPPMDQFGGDGVYEFTLLKDFVVKDQKGKAVKESWKLEYVDLHDKPKFDANGDHIESFTIRLTPLTTIPEPGSTRLLLAFALSSMLLLRKNR